MNLFDKIPTRKPRTKKEIIEFLSSHFRYHTLRSWNRMTSYAHNVKIYNLPWKSKDAESKAYDLISTAQAARCAGQRPHIHQWGISFEIVNHKILRFSPFSEWLNTNECILNLTRNSPPV